MAQRISENRNVTRFRRFICPKTVIEILSSENAGHPRHSFRPVISSAFIAGVPRKLYCAKGRSENDLSCSCIAPPPVSNYHSYIWELETFETHKGCAPRVLTRRREKYNIKHVIVYRTDIYTAQRAAAAAASPHRSKSNNIPRPI